MYGECAFCWHRPHPQGECGYEYQDGTVCACVEFEEEPAADYDPGDAAMQCMNEQRTRRMGEGHAA